LARLTVDNPPLNILSSDVRAAMLAHLNRIAGSPDIAVVVVESQGSSFSAGSDIREFPDNETGGIAKIRYEQHLLNRLSGLEQVVIAKVRGHTLGGGAELMLACDLRVADNTARIGFPEIKLAALPAAGGMKRLVRDIGPIRSAEMIMTGEPISAERALELGLLNQVVVPADLDNAISTLVDRFVVSPLDALRLAKRCIKAAIAETPIDTIESQAFAELYRGQNLMEGVAAFLGKRQPHFDRTDPV
jgi:enoyl-CoA hydratase/carnithine racemase